MSKFKKGDRVQQRDKDGILHRGTVDDVYDDCVYGTRDAGGRFVAGPWDLIKIDDDPAPLRFEDVRTDDLITVQVQDTTVTGPVNASIDDTGRAYIITVKHANLCLKPNHDVGVWFVTGTGRKATLIAHTPAEPEPEWRRAKVIKAGNDYLVRCASTGVFRDQQGVAWSTDELTNVRVIVDAEGKVRA